MRWALILVLSLLTRKAVTCPKFMQSLFQQTFTDCVPGTALGAGAHRRTKDKHPCSRGVYTMVEEEKY